MRQIRSCKHHLPHLLRCLKRNLDCRHKIPQVYVLRGHNPCKYFVLFHCFKLIQCQVFGKNDIDKRLSFSWRVESEKVLIFAKMSFKVGKNLF